MFIAEKDPDYGKVENIQLIRKFEKCSLWVAQDWEGKLVYTLCKSEETEDDADLWVWGECLRDMPKFIRRGFCYPSCKGEEAERVCQFIKDFLGNPDIKRAADCLAYGRKCRKRGMIQTALEYEAKGEKGLSKTLGYTISDALLTAWETTSAQVHPKELNEWSDFL